MLLTAVRGACPAAFPGRAATTSVVLTAMILGAVLLCPRNYAQNQPSAHSRGFLGNVKNFDGSIKQQPVHDNIWLPSHQEFVARGRELIKGFRIRQVDELNDYLKASTDVFQQMHAPNVDAGEARKVPN